MNTPILTFSTSHLNTGTMSASPPTTEAPPSEYAGILGDSSDSDREPSPEDQLLVSWENLPVLERLGLTSAAQMTEDEVESVFTQVALAFRCDQYTLAQRRHAEEHDRTVARYNIDLELERSRDMLQSLRGMCAGAEWLSMLSQIECRLDMVLGGVQDIITAAEILGAVHQEARVCHSVEVMELHLVHLKRRHSVDNAELLQTRKMLYSNQGRRHSDSGDGDVSHLLVRRDSQQTLNRRRVSITVIPTAFQLSDLETKFQEGCRSSADTDSQSPEGDSVNQPGRPSETSTVVPRLVRQNSIHGPESLEDQGQVVPHTSSSLTVLHHRRRSLTLERKLSSEDTQTERSTARSLASTSKLRDNMSESIWPSDQPVAQPAKTLSSATRVSYCRRMTVGFLVLALSILLLLFLLHSGI
ncbi:hypothetical protein DPEC_G00194790 [Dallia pectoralis]|uniref:Uncharacterized protein n=1 Tax=Dallia pectoralis TaxID=75939 RepID=A0ACC2G6V4_DALPE|nr:hypothetical protein DPEC_G00194790 [Dallia pectoralis]